MTVKHLPLILQSSPRTLFCCQFILWALSFSLLFEHWQFVFVSGYLHPVSIVVAMLLNAVGVDTQLDTASLSQGFCLLRMDKLTFRVIFECTGIFSLFIFSAATLAYPAPVVDKAWGLLLGSIGFFLYSSLRLVLLGVVGDLAPHWVQFSHLWLVLINMSFAVFVWLSWINRVRAT